MQNSQIRSFIAAELPLGVKSKLDELQQDLKRSGLNYVKWVNPSGIHLTLKFLGNVDIQDIDRITDAIKEGCKGSNKFSIEISGLGVFPNYKRPRVVWLGIEGQVPLLINLQRQIDDKMELLGFAKEKRPFSPHITLGRVRDTASVYQIKECGDVIEGKEYNEKHNFVIDSIKLMKSQLLPTGAVYTEIAAVQLP